LSGCRSAMSCSAWWRCFCSRDASRFTASPTSPINRGRHQLTSAVVVGPFAEGERLRLAEHRIALSQEKARLQLRLGRHAETVGELSAVMAVNPNREPLSPAPDGRPPLCSVVSRSTPVTRSIDGPRLDQKRRSGLPAGIPSRSSTGHPRGVRRDKAVRQRPASASDPRVPTPRPLAGRIVHAW
jgi:hypothetical protein